MRLLEFLEWRGAPLPYRVACLSGYAPWPFTYTALAIIDARRRGSGSPEQRSTHAANVEMRWHARGTIQIPDRPAG